MKKILLIDPYFGTLPKDWFQLIMNSCSFNDTINWLLITDDHTAYNYPSNVKVVYEEWSIFVKKVKEKVYKKLGIKCVLDNPYKLCDYKPLYGMLFEDYIEKYDYWGYSDMTDVIYGNLRHFLTNDILKYDKVNYLGHLTLFKNTATNNIRFTIPLKNGVSIKDIITNNKNLAFDEIVGVNNIQQIYDQNNFSFALVKDMVADVSPLRYAFQLSKFDENYQQYYEKYRKRIFSFKEGKLMSYYLENNKLKSQEYGYVHLQKRKMIAKTYENSFLIVPNSFLNYYPVNKKLVKQYSPKRIYLPFFKLKFRALCTRLKIK